MSWQRMETAPKEHGAQVLGWFQKVKLDEDDTLTDEVIGGAMAQIERQGDGWTEPDWLDAHGSYFFEDWSFAPEPVLWHPLPPEPVAADYLATHGVTLPSTTDRMASHEQPLRQDHAPARDGGADRSGDRSGELRHGATEPDGTVGVDDGRQGAARAHDASGPSAVLAGFDASRDALALLPRIDAAIQRIVNGQGCMRIPADPEDPDLVLADCKRLLSHVYGVMASHTDQGESRG